ncbi:3-oxoacyl-[acyl-carrier-protein] reductase FabG [Microbacterium oxydans]|uniref:3-oxoacyl-[acyl-carrier-protein] reductase FabG n=1 Tax=Microbacterium oxydans TaxID=82380 RepID=A0A0F0LHK7_9MICO|nr:3-oxoacyl-[acyl-carrier-protein] reductase FabG [Microbacterium oxydans]
MPHALVTGSSRGIGRAIAQTLARRGDRVVVHYASDRAAAEETLASLEGSGHAVVGGDIGSPTEAQRVVVEAIAAVGSLDILVNNAAERLTRPNALPSAGFLESGRGKRTCPNEAHEADAPQRRQIATTPAPTTASTAAPTKSQAKPPVTASAVVAPPASSAAVRSPAIVPSTASPTAPPIC